MKNKLILIILGIIIVIAGISGYLYFKKGGNNAKTANQQKPIEDCVKIYGGPCP